MRFYLKNDDFAPEWPNRGLELSYKGQFIIIGQLLCVFVQSICMGIVNEDEDIVIKRVKLEDDRKDTMRYWAHSQNLFRLE